MRHRKQKAILGREATQRRALMRGLAESMIIHGSLRTTQAKAKAIRMFVEPLITRAKRNTVADRRAIIEILHTDAAVRKLMSDIAPRYVDRRGGYTRIIKLSPRPRDAAQMAKIEFV